MSEAWTRWQGHLINGAFPLGRCLGCSDHSGVFLTKSAARPEELAIKLVPTNRALAEAQLPRWKRAGGLAHPHLLRLFEWGGCQLEGLPYLYTVMEYADQTLAQLLLRRALTEDEARELLLPTLDALAFLHGRNLLQGQLKPANILVVGDQLKLATDTIRRVSEGMMSTHTPTVYDAPEARQGSNSTAGDVWALGVTLVEALTRRPPSGLGEPRKTTLPAEFSQSFDEVVTRCLSPTPEDRPSVNELAAWARGPSAESPPPEATQPVAPLPAESAKAEPPPPRTPSPPVAPEAARPAPSTGQRPKPRVVLAVILGAVVILALAWTGVRAFRTHHAAIPPPPPVQDLGKSPSPTPGGGAPGAAEVRPPVSGVSTSKGGRGAVATPPSGLHEEIPDVPWSARRTIRGHIKVWVRVMVDPDGSVFAAVTDRTGPSNYFQRVAIEAAKKWRFPPVDTPARRMMQVRFEFTRDGTTGRAVTPR
jgi:TonB family protein